MPGAVTRDGSPVEVYRALPPGRAPELIHSAVPEGCEILELGCGAGRTTHALIALGHRVTAVDESPEMLSHVRGATTVVAQIEALELGKRYPAVLLASHFVNTPDLPERTRLLGACWRHVTDDGSVLVQCYDPDFDWLAAVGRPRAVGDVRVTLTDASVNGPRVSATVEYALGVARWIQEFEAEILGEPQLAEALAATDLRFVRWLSRDEGWFEAQRA